MLNLRLAAHARPNRFAMLAVDGEIVDDQLVDSSWAPNSVSRRKEHTATSLETALQDQVSSAALQASIRNLNLSVLNMN